MGAETTTVWWDYDNVPLPENYDCNYTVENIKIALMRIGIFGSVKVFAVGDVDGLSPRLRKAFYSTMDLRYSDYGPDFDSSKIIIISEIHYWAMKHPDTKNYLIISNDFEIYQTTFELLQNRSCQVMIAHSEELSSSTPTTSKATWQFSRLIRGQVPIGYVGVGYHIELDINDLEFVQFPHPHVSIPSSFRNIDSTVFCGVKLSVWWDIESCPVPGDCDAAAIPLNLQTAIQRIGFYDPITIYTDTTRIDYSSSVRLGYDRGLFNFVGAKYTPDEMAIAMIKWAENNRPSATCLLISSDESYSSILHELSGKGYKILLGHQGDHSHSQTTLTASASYLWDWSSLAHGDVPYRIYPSLKRKFWEDELDKAEAVARPPRQVWETKK